MDSIKATPQHHECIEPSSGKLRQLEEQIQEWAKDLGFQQLAITDTDLSAYTEEHRTWVEKQFHGDMSYMERNVDKRHHPERLLPGTIRIISVRMDYLPVAEPSELVDSNKGYIALYALGRDYHKTIRRRLAKLADLITEEAGGSHRAFVDSAPILEKPIAEKAGLGWMGKNTLILNEHGGSYFFLGEIFTDLPLPITSHSTTDRCGKCKACLNICPTQAFVGPRKLDARRCISYLTIENKGPIDVEFREAIGNRIFGCDDCQLICPWNRYAKKTQEPDFVIRHGLDNRALVELLAWDEPQFLRHTAGMAIRRINYQQWVRNLAVAAGNAESSAELLQILVQKRDEAVQRNDEMCVEHIDWAVAKLSPSASS